MNIAVDTKVYCTDGFYGRSACVILNPATEQVTHIAVQQEGLYSHTWLVPMSHVIDSSTDRIQLDLSKKQIEDDMLPFIKTEFLTSDLPDTIYTTDLIWPRLIANLEMKTLKHENISLDELAVRSGAIVEAQDGVIGHLENLVVDLENKHVTQIVIRAGHWLSHSRFAIPVSAIDHFDEDAIYLSLNKQETQALAAA